MKVEPVPTRLVRDPVTGSELTVTLDVPDGSPFWLRRVADGDVKNVGIHADPVALLAHTQTSACLGVVSQSKADTKGGSQ